MSEQEDNTELPINKTIDIQGLSHLIRPTAEYLGLELKRVIKKELKKQSKINESQV